MLDIYVIKKNRLIQGVFEVEAFLVTRGTIQCEHKVWNKIHNNVMDVFKKITRTGRFYFEKCHPVTCNLSLLFAQ
jgi:hypothetical protein